MFNNNKMIIRIGIVIVIFGVTLFSFGIFSVLSNQMFYLNYRGEPVFGPVFIVLGLAIALIGGFKKDMGKEDAVARTSRYRLNRIEQMY